MINQFVSSLFPRDTLLASLSEGLIYFLILFILLRIVAWIALKIGTNISSRTSNTLDDSLVAAVKSVLIPAITFIAFTLTVVNFFPTILIGDYPLDELLIYVGILLGAWIANKIVGAAVKWYDEDLQSSSKGKKKELFSFVRKIIGWGIYAVAFMIMLDRMGIQIAPLLAGLGVAGLAVALALQGTLSNLFAGMHILADKPFRVGQFIMINNDPEKVGVVEEVGWRSTRIRMPNNNVLIIPNGKLSESEVTNTSYPSAPMVVVLKVNAAYGDPIEKVERALREAAKEIVKNKAIFDQSFTPIVRANAFGESGIEYAVVVQVNDFMAQYPARGALVKAVEKSFKKYKITIPYQTKIVKLEKY